MLKFCGVRSGTTLEESRIEVRCAIIFAWSRLPHRKLFVVALLVEGSVFFISACFSNGISKPNPWLVNFLFYIYFNH